MLKLYLVMSLIKCGSFTHVWDEGTIQLGGREGRATRVL